jgi:hypothetical protein
MRCLRHTVEQILVYKANAPEDLMIQIDFWKRCCVNQTVGKQPCIKTNERCLRISLTKLFRTYRFDVTHISHDKNLDAFLPFSGRPVESGHTRTGKTGVNR